MDINFDLSRVFVVSIRVIRQLKRDRRTIGLITLAPLFLMILFGYALSGDMSGVKVGIVEDRTLQGQDGTEAGLVKYLQGLDSLDILYLGSESDALKLIESGDLSGTVVLKPDSVRLLLDASSPQISNSIVSFVKAGLMDQLEGSKSNEKTSAVTMSDYSGSSAVLQSQLAAGSASIAYDADIQANAPSSIAGNVPTIDIRYVYGYDLETMDSVGPAVLGLVVFFFTFIMASISFLRERTQGTLEKFMVSPLSRFEMVLGYLLGFSLFAIIQSSTTLLVVVYGFKVPMIGSPILALGVVLLLGAVALGLGSLFSNFATSEFQVVQFIPMVILPQVVLTGVWWPLESIPEFIRPISYLLPLTYSSHALREIMLKGATIGDIMPDLAVLCLFLVITFTAATVMLRREVG